MSKSFFTALSFCYVSSTFLDKYREKGILPPFPQNMCFENSMQLSAASSLHCEIYRDYAL